MNCKFLTGSNLKIIALVSMFIDHIAAVGLVKNPLIYETMRIIGRLSFPIFAFLITEGYFYTKNIKKYLIRLGIFALISEIPFDLAFKGQILEFSHQNVFFTLFLGLLGLFFINRNQQIGTILLIILGVFADVINADYGIYGIITIFLFYRFRENFKIISLSFIGLNLCLLLISMNDNFSFFNQFLSILALTIIYFYNNKKGKGLKYLFYTFYPLHLLILYLFTMRLKG